MASIIPDPGTYQEETAQALRAYNDALAAIGARRANTLQSYGFTATVDPTTGALTNYSIDPHNQYGQIQQLFNSQQAGQQNLEQSDLSRGIGTLGLAGRLAAQLRTQQGGQTQALGQAFLGEIGSEAADQMSAATTYSGAKLQAQRDAIAAAIQNQQFNPAPVASAPSTSIAPGARANQAGVSAGSPKTAFYKGAKKSAYKFLAPAGHYAPGI